MVCGFVNHACRETRSSCKKHDTEISKCALYKDVKPTAVMFNAKCRQTRYVKKDHWLVRGSNPTPAGVLFWVFVCFLFLPIHCNFRS